MSEWTLKRDTFTPKSTTGKLLDGDDKFICYVLEDVVRPVKIAGETAIPEGRFRVVIDMSARFKRLMPHILNVPDFEGVRLHWGNTAANTEGCPLVGLTRARDFVGMSRRAFDELVWPRLQEDLAMGEVWLTVKSATDGRGA